MSSPIITFTPEVDYDVVVTATFEAQRTSGAGDWGGSGPGGYYLRWESVANPSTVFEQSQTYPMSDARAKYTQVWRFTAMAGVQIRVYQFGTCGLGYVVTFYNQDLRVEGIKR